MGEVGSGLLPDEKEGFLRIPTTELVSSLVCSSGRLLHLLVEYYPNSVRAREGANDGPQLSF